MADESVSDHPNANGNVAKSKLNGSKRHVLQSVIKEFTQRSSIHGISYLGDRKLYRYEQFWWGFLLISSVIGCGLLIYQTYVKWDENAIIVSFAKKESSVWDVPFPAITVCPQRKIKQRFLNASDFYVEVLKSGHGRTTDSEDRDIFKMIAFLRGNQMKQASWPTETTDTANQLIEEMRFLAPNVNDTFAWCSVETSKFPCKRSIITDIGVCFSINMLGPVDLYREGLIHNDDGDSREAQWTRDTGFRNIDGRYVYPYRSYYYQSGVNGFRTTIKIDADKEYIRDHSPQKTGYTIFLHPPDEIPNNYRHTFKLFVQNIEETLIAITPNMITTSKELRSYSPRRRMCYFSDEKYLSFFKVYTQSNCEIECLANLTLEHCGCVKFSMPRRPTTDICGFNKIECVYDASVLYFEPNSSNARSIYSMQNSCDCLPSCTQISYRAELRSRGDDLLIGKIYSLAVGEGSELTEAYFDYKSHSFQAGVRSEIFGMNDFLASCGGLLGLFMGVSLVSLLEIIYFCTVRICVNIGTKSKVNPAEGN